MRNLEKLNKQRAELQQMLLSGDADKEENKEYIRQMQAQMAEKEKKLAALIDELTKKSTLNED